MRTILVIIQLASVLSDTNLKDGHCIKSVLQQNITFRQSRCAAKNKVDSFFDSTVNFVVTDDGLKDLLNNNDGDCMGENILRFPERLTNGLLVDEDVPDSHWHDYKAAFDKMYYSPDHEMAARATWQRNLKLVARHNRDYLSGKQSFSLHLNNFGDWQVADYVEQILKLMIPLPRFDPARDYSRQEYHRIKHRTAPREVDWRKMGFNPRREEQWHCGACYAFAVTHTLQGQLFKRHRRWPELSPQQIVDCSDIDGNTGCNGGSLQAAFRYAARVGLAAEIYYPYLGKEGICHNSDGKRVRPRRWATLPAGDELALEKALATIGPLAVAVNAAPVTFQLYRSGIYDDPFCIPWKMNHAMLLVGYTPSYWILLNWWGRQWGEDGYIRIRRGYGTCGVANMATYAEL